LPFHLDAERGAEQKIPRRGHPLKHWPQHLCRWRAVARRVIIFAAALHRVAHPERAPERLKRAHAGREELPHRDHFINRQRDHQQHREGGGRVECTPVADGQRLEDHEHDVRDAQRHDQNEEEGRHPRHRAPLHFPAYLSHEHFKGVGHARIPASETGIERETSEVSALTVLSPKNGSQTVWM
jgi:hypothetical protein